MEFIPDIMGFFDGIALLVATAVGAVWLTIRSFLGRFGLAILTGLGRGAGSGLGSRFAGGAGAQLNSRRMPTNPTGRHARQALLNAEARQLRMRSYVDAWLDLLATRGGPFAVSMHLQGLISSGFRDKVVRLRRRCREFDRLEAIAQRVVQRYERDYEARCEPIRDRILELNTEMTRCKARHRRFALQFWKRRWRHHKRRQIAIRRKLMLHQYRLRRSEWRLGLAYRSLIEPALVAVDQYERAYLMHWVHSFEADLESFRLTVVTGRLLDMLFAPGMEEMRAYLGLDSLPSERAGLRRYLVATLEAAGVGHEPLAHVESLFEAYLRIRLAADAELRRRWHVDRDWLLEALPAPGSLGVAAARHGHATPMRRWLADEPEGERPGAESTRADGSGPVRRRMERVVAPD